MRRLAIPPLAVALPALAVALPTLAVACGPTDAETATLVISDGRIWSGVMGEDAFTGSVAIVEDRMAAVGSVQEIGDRAISTLLDIFERVESEAGPRDRRFRIEHAQHVHPDDFERFARLDVIASMQPYHAIDDGWRTA